MSGATRLKRAARIILIGAPGVGKGTQAERMIQRYKDVSAISSGDLLRSAVRNKTSIGIEAAALMNKGNLVPDAMILRLILRELQARSFIPTGSSLSDAQAGKKLEASDAPGASFLLDGYPRTATQAAKLAELIPPNFVVHLQTSTETLLQRITGRWVHESSGRVYNTGFNEPKVPGRDDVTGDKLVQREDDSEAVWRERLRNFESTSGPLLEYYDKLGVLWRIKGETSDEISPKLFKEFERRFA